MAMFERRMFLKPICATHQFMASGIATDIETWQDFFTIPWNKLGYLKRIEIGRTCSEFAYSGCVKFEIYDDFYDPITEVSGLVKRKSITIPFGVDQISLDETEDVPLIGTIYGFSEMVSGLDVTLCARLMG